MVGLVFAVLTACLVSTIGSALNALSTIFTMDIYVKKFHPNASQQRINYVGRIVTVIGSILAIILTVAIDSVKGLNLFNIFQSVLSFIAPPMTAVFLLGVFWSRTTTRAANFALTIGTAFCLIVGILYLWGPESGLWPHFMMLSFLLCIILIITMVGISMLDKHPIAQQTVPAIEKQQLADASTHSLSRLVVTLWLLLAAVMIGLYIFFN